MRARTQVAIWKSASEPLGRYNEVQRRIWDSLDGKRVGTTVGYGGRSYFSRAFRAAYGTDPKTFRSQNHEISRPRVMEG